MQVPSAKGNITAFEIQVGFQALNSITNLECQLFCLERDYPVRDYGQIDSNYNSGGDYLNTKTESKSWWKSTLIRKTFYDLESHTDNLKIFEKMRDWLSIHNDAEINNETEIAINNVILNVARRREKEHDQQISYVEKGVIASNAVNIASSYREKIEGIITYNDLMGLEQTVKASLIELESAAVEQYEAEYETPWGGPPDMHTSGHHKDTLDILHAAYKNYTWKAASSSSLYEYDENEGEFFISDLHRSFSSVIGISSCQNQT